MHFSPGLTIDDLAVPPSDGQVLIWPDAAALSTLAEANRGQRQGRQILLLGRPADEWSAASSDVPLRFMFGHQPDFFHPGVWLKGVAAECLALAAGGTHSFLLVDSDVPGQIRLEWPEKDGDRLEKRSRSVGSGEAPFEALSAGLTDGMIAMLVEIRSPAASDALIPRFRSGFEALRSAPYVDRWIAGFSAGNDELGLALPEFVRVSRLFKIDGPEHASAAAFVAHLLLHAEAFAAAYNRAIADYRHKRGIRGTRHPIPDLETGPDRIELPLWLLRPAQPRRRLFVSPAGRDAIRLSADETLVGVADPTALRREPAKALAELCGGWRIRPRALAQTMYARLCLCDLFIHGIGGAKYDQITDRVIRSFFEVEPPAFGCVSATLWLALNRFDAAEDELARLRRFHRDFRHNPQRYLANDPISPTLRACLDERADAIHESERLREEAPRNRAARRAAYDRIRRANACLLADVPPALGVTPDRIDELERRIRHDRIAKHREWFFALYPADKLKQLANTLKRALQ